MADTFLNDRKWVKRVQQFFEVLDLNKSNTVSIADWQMWVDNIEREVKPKPELLEKLKQRMHNYAEQMGLKQGVQLTKDQFVQEFAKFAATQSAKVAKGDRPLIFELNDAWYDVVDTNHDGFITLDEYTKVLKSSNFGDASEAKAAFDAVDANHDGRISRDELTQSEYKFWFTVGDKTTEGMFGSKF